MASLPKHLTQKPTLVHIHVELTIDGGDIRQPAMQELWAAMEEAAGRVTDAHGLERALSRKLRSVEARRFRKALRKKGFGVPLEPPRTVAAVDPVDGVVTK